MFFCFCFLTSRINRAREAEGSYSLLIGFSFLLSHRMKPVLKRRKRGKVRLKNMDKGQANHARAIEDVNCSLFLSLPVHLIFVILARLPICTLLICKHVCNTLKNIVSDPDFTHLAKASFDDYHLVIQKKNNPAEIFLTPLCYLDKHALNSQTNDHCDDKFLPWHTLTMPHFIPKAYQSYGQVAYLVGSSNGLLCLRYCGYDVKYFYVCNPILGEFTVLPGYRDMACEVGGFGFCPKIKKYKVLRFIYYAYKYCDILTLGTDDDWRRISDAPPLPESFVDFGSSYHGNFHWIVGNLWSEILICSFNLETEKYSYISPPSCLNNSMISPILIGTLDGLFCVSFINFNGQFEVYVMEDYEVKDSWIKRVSFYTGNWFNFFGDDISISTVRLLDNGVLVLHRRTHVVYFDTRKGTSSDITVEGNYCAMVHIPSLMSLKDIVKRENVEQVKRKMLHIFSLKASKRQSN